MSALPQYRDQRHESRRATQGAVMVRFDNPQPFVIHGKLLDVSPHGFRMSHEYRGLDAGSVVEYSHTESAGKARVCWNRIVETRVETGFLVLPE